MSCKALQNTLLIVPLCPWTPVSPTLKTPNVELLNSYTVIGRWHFLGRRAAEHYELAERDKRAPPVDLATRTIEGSKVRYAGMPLAVSARARSSLAQTLRLHPLSSTNAIFQIASMDATCSCSFSVTRFRFQSESERSRGRTIERSKRTRDEPRVILEDSPYRTSLPRHQSRDHSQTPNV